MVFLAFIIFSGLHLVTLASAHGEVTEGMYNNLNEKLRKYEKAVAFKVLISTDLASCNWKRNYLE